MLENIFFGGTFAFAAAVQPGPLQAYLFTRVVEHGWRRTLPAALSPLLSDGPIALVVLLLLRTVPGTLQWVLRLAGGALLLYLAATTYRDWRRQSRLEAGPTTAPRTLLQAAAVNVLNPNPYLGWSLVLGPQALSAWAAAPARAAALVVSFYATMTVMLALIIVAFGTTRVLGERGRRHLVFISTIALAGLGVYQVVVGVRAAAGW